MPTPRLTLGLIPAHRGAFNLQLATAMRGQVIDAMRQAGHSVVVPTAEQTKGGCVQDYREAELCAELFRRERVAGIVIAACNFGDEQSAAATVRRAGLNVPVLLFGCQEDEPLAKSTPYRRDAFCGLLSLGEALRQTGTQYSVARRPIGFPTDPAFADDLDWFVRVCRVVNGVRNARYGQVGTRPNPFCTCRCDEKQLQRLGAATVVIDMAEVIAAATAIDDADPQVAQIVASIQQYADTSGVLPASVVRSAKLELFLRRWREENALDALAIQCWTAIQRHYGVCGCTTMSRFSDEGLPAACEADVLGAMSMHACTLASGAAVALADWNNLHHADDELVNLWHCGAFPRSFGLERPRMAMHKILVARGGAPPDHGEGVLEMTLRPAAVTLCRITQDADGLWKALVVEGQIEEHEEATFGCYGWCRVPGLPNLYRNVLLRHFPHHVALTHSLLGDVLAEALGNYLGMKLYP
jgi:L-fucose isomerase-like protein